MSTLISNRTTSILAVGSQISDIICSPGALHALAVVHPATQLYSRASSLSHQ